MYFHVLHHTVFLIINLSHAVVSKTPMEEESASHPTPPFARRKRVLQVVRWPHISFIILTLVFVFKLILLVSIISTKAEKRTNEC